jgi:hypothetical protein
MQEDAVGMEQPMAAVSEAIITVTHEADGGWHTFMSEQVPGLFLTGQDEDLQELYESLPAIIAALTRADFGVDVIVSQQATFTSYLDTLRPTHIPPTSHYSIRPQAA